MLKNRTIAIAISSALLALLQVDAAPGATPLTTVRVASKPSEPLHVGHASGDFDRAFILQRTVEASIEESKAEESPGAPAWADRQPDPAAPNTDRSRLRFIPATRPIEIQN
jgi:hypothetical protein